MKTTTGYFIIAASLFPWGNMVADETKTAVGQQAEASSGRYYSEFSHKGFYAKDYFVYRSPIDDANAVGRERVPANLNPNHDYRVRGIINAVLSEQ